MKQILILCSVLLLCSGSCEKTSLAEKFYGFVVDNNSTDTIRIYIADEHILPQYPDTSLSVSPPPMQKVAPGKKGYFYSKSPWEENIQKLPADTLSVYVIDHEVFVQESWETIRNNYLVLKRYDLSASDLKNMGWKIAYP